MNGNAVHPISKMEHAFAPSSPINSPKDRISLIAIKIVEFSPPNKKSGKSRTFFDGLYLARQILGSILPLPLAPPLSFAVSLSI